MTGDVESGSHDRPRFRGCVFCYAGELTYHGAKRAVRRLRTDDGT